MAATSTTGLTTSGSRRNAKAEPLLARLLAGCLAAGAISVLVLGRGTLAQEIAANGWELLVWVAIVITVDLFPIALGRIRLTLDLPVLLATALLYPPTVAAALGLFAALDVREIKKQVDATSAVFNRAQIALSLYLAGVTFHALAGEITVSAGTIGATVVALAVDFLANAGLVALFVILRERGDLSAARREFVTANPGLLLTTHLGYGVLAFLLATISQGMGLWSVALFLVPIVAARQLLIRNEQLRAATEQLRERERLLGQLFQGTAEERRDERLRIASDLHDDVLQILTRIQQIAGTLASRIDQPLEERDAEELVAAGDAGMRSLRDVMQNLKKSPLGPGGLIPTLRTLVRDSQVGQAASIRLVSPATVEASEEVLLAAYHVAREALANSLKHSRASVIEVCVRQNDSSLVVEVRDDGTGFDPGLVDPNSHFGLDLTKERVTLAGGQFTISSSIASGTRVSTTFVISE
jgi:signal transduction histidine kinase